MSFEKWVRTGEVAEHLGKPPSWIHNNADRLGIPRSKIGNQYRYKLSEVEEWLKHQH